MGAKTSTTAAIDASSILFAFDDTVAFTFCHGRPGQKRVASNSPRLFNPGSYRAPIRRGSA